MPNYTPQEIVSGQLERDQRRENEQAELVELRAEVKQLRENLALAESALGKTTRALHEVRRMRVGHLNFAPRFHRVIRAGYMEAFRRIDAELGEPT